MDMTGERRIPAPRQKVWDALNDPAVLKACIPGCESLEKLSEHEMKATAAVKIGPISARFTGKVQLTDINPPTSYRIGGEGQGGVAGFAKGGADVHLSDDGAGTLLKYDVKAQVGGKIAQLGARLIDATSKQMADLFFDKFSATVAAGSPVIAVPAAAIAPVAPAVMAGGSPVPPGTVATDGPIGAIAAMTGDAASTARPASAPLASTPAPKISIFSLLPKEPFGFPPVATIGTAIWLVIFFLLFKGYVFG